MVTRIAAATNTAPKPSASRRLSTSQGGRMGRWVAGGWRLAVGDEAPVGIDKLNAALDAARFEMGCTDGTMAVGSAVGCSDGCGSIAWTTACAIAADSCSATGRNVWASPSASTCALNAVWPFTSIWISTLRCVTAGADAGFGAGEKAAFDVERSGDACSESMMVPGWCRFTDGAQPNYRRSNGGSELKVYQKLGGGILSTVRRNWGPAFLIILSIRQKHPKTLNSC